MAATKRAARQAAQKAKRGGADAASAAEAKPARRQYRRGGARKGARRQPASLASVAVRGEALTLPANGSVTIAPSIQLTFNVQRGA